MLKYQVFRSSDDFFVAPHPAGFKYSTDESGEIYTPAETIDAADISSAILLLSLQERYPSLFFEVTDTCYHPRNEDATYYSRAPAGWTEQGVFIRISNPVGGVDVVPADKPDQIERLADWHQTRATAQGF
jgi:hypothetical protein